MPWQKFLFDSREYKWNMTKSVKRQISTLCTTSPTELKGEVLLFLWLLCCLTKKKKKEKSVLPETNSALEDTSTGLCNTGRQDPECKTATPTCDILATASQRGLNTELSPVFILNSVQLNMNPWGVYFFFLPLYQKNVRHTGKVWQLFHTQSCLIPLMYKH